MKHRNALLERGGREAIADEERQKERGDRWVITGSASFKVAYDGYVLVVDFMHDTEEKLTLVGGGRFNEVELL